MGRRTTAAAALVAALSLAAAASAESAPSRLVTSPAALVVTAQAGAQADVTLRAEDESGAPLSGVTWLAETSVGSISAVTEPEPGRYVARLQVPPDDMPRAALVVLSPQGREDLALQPQWRVVPVGVRTTLSARTEPRSQVSAAVGARSFGPVEAGRDGAFSLDVELSPGTREAQVRLKDLAGNETATSLPVPVRPHDPLTVTLDRYRVASDGRSSARVFAFTFDDAGRALQGASVTATATIGEVSAFTEEQPGLWTARYAPPKDGREGFAEIDVQVARNGRTITELERIAVVRGLPGSLKLEATPMQVVAGTTPSVALLARVTDAAGNPLAGQPVQVFADRGELSQPADRGDGSYGATLVPPALVESGSLEIKALLPVGGPARVPARMVVTADPKAVPTSWRAFSLVTAVVSDAEGRPVPGEIVLFHLSRGLGTVTPASITYDAGQAFADFSADPTEEIVTVEAVSTSNPSLRGSVSIEKRSSGQFAIVSRPAVVAQGGQGGAMIVLAEDKRILQDTLLLEMIAGAPQRLVASADPTRLPADGQSQSRITARLLDASGNEVREHALAWSVDRGAISGDSEDDDGLHEAAFTAPEGRGSGGATVTVSHAASGLTASVPIELDLGPPASLQLAADRTELPADGTSRAILTATVLDASGAAIPGARVGFEIASGEAAVDPAATADAAGRAVASLIASTIPGDVTVTATLEEGGLTATADLRLLSLRPERLVVSASPARIAADGQDRAEILALVEDGLGERLEDEPLTFRVIGRARLAPQDRVRTNADGEARAWLSGDVAETATIRVTCDRAPGLSEDVTVELVAGALDVAILADACSAAVRLTAVVPEGTATPPLAVEWDWTGDGVADGTGESALTSLAPGPAEVTVTVRDAAGRRGSATTTLNVLPSPTAVIEGAPPQAGSGSVVHLDATDSAGMPPLVYAWDLDGDGAPEGTGAEIDWAAPDGLRTASLTVTDATGCSLTATAQVVFGDPPDLSTTLRVLGASRIAPAQTTTLEIGWQNAGPPAAANVELVLTLAGPATILAATLPPAAILRSPGEVAFPLGPLQPSTSGTLKVDVVAGQDFPGAVAVVTATSRVSTTSGDPAPANDAATASIVVERDVDLAVALRASAGSPVAAGAPLDVILDVTNLSTSDAPDVTAQITWDPALWVADPSSLPPGALGGHATIDVGLLLGGQARSIVVRGAVASELPAASQDLAFAAEAFFTGSDRNPADNRARLTREVVAAPDLAIVLEAIPSRSPSFPGDTIQYVATWTNAGTTAAEGVEVVATMTAGTLAELEDNPNGGTRTGDQIAFHLGRVGAGATAQLRWTIRLGESLPAGLSRACSDVVISEAAGLDVNPGNDRDARCVDVENAPALAVSVAAPASAAAGGTVTYVVTVTNTGAQADGVDVELSLSGARLVAGAASGDPLVLRTSFGSVVRGTPRTWRQAVTIPCPQAASDPLVDALATVIVAGAPTAVRATHRLAVAARPDLAASLAFAASGRAGDTLAGTLTIANIGCAPCSEASGTVTWDAALAGGTQPLTLMAGALAPGISAARPFTVTALPTLPAATNVLAVAGAASCGDGDADATNDVATASATLTAAPDAGIASIVAVPPSPLPAATDADVTVLVSNSGTTSASSVTVSLAAADPSLIVPVAPASIVLASIAPGQSAPATFRVRTAPTLPAASQATSLRAALTCAGDAVPANDAASLPLTLVAAPDLGVALTLAGSTDPPLPGSIVTATVDVANSGTTASSGATLRLEHDASLLVAIDPVAVPLAALAPGLATALPPFRFQLVSPLPPGAALTQVTARVADPLDGNPSNDAMTADLALGDVVDVGVDLTLTPGTVPLRAGGSVRMTVKAVNDGGRDAVSIRAVATWSPPELVADQIPSSVISSTPGRLEWLVDGLPAGDPGKTWDILLRVPATLPATFNPIDVDVALLSDPVQNPEIDFSDNQDSSGLVATAESDACTSVVATATPARAVPGGRLRYDVTVENRGTTTARAPVLVLATDPWLGAATSTEAGALALAGSTQWTLLPLAPGDTATRFAEFAIPLFGAGERSRFVDATATTTAAEEGPAGCPATSAISRVHVTVEADLRVEKRLLRATENPPRRGTRLTYEIVVTNVGNQASAPGTLTDAFPPETTLVSTSPVASVSGNVLTWSVPALAPDVGQPYQAVLEVAAGLPPGTYVLHNEATSSCPSDSNAGNDAASHDLAMNLDVDLVTALTCVPDTIPPVPGTAVTCTGTVRNDGSYPATNPRLLLDAGTLGTLDAPSLALSPAPLAPGATSAPFSFRVRTATVMPAPANSLVVTATAQADEPDADPSDDRATATLDYPAWTDLHADLVAVDANGPPLVAGDRIDLTLRLSNAGGTMPAWPVAVTSSYDAALCDVEPGGDLAGGGGTLTGALAGPLLPTSAPVPLTWSLRVKAVLPSTENVITTCAGGSAPAERSPNDDRACAPPLVAVAWPDLVLVSLVATAPANPAAPGDVVQYDAVVRNEGTTRATAVRLRDDRRDDLTTSLLWASVPATDVAGVVTLTLPDMDPAAAVPPGPDVAVSWRIGLAPSMPAPDTSVPTQACASSSQPDRVTADNCASVTVPVHAPVDAGVDAMLATISGSCGPGSQLLLTITPRNRGSAPAPAASVTVDLPAEVDVLSAPGSVPGSAPLRFDLGSLAPFTTLPPLQVTLRVKDELPAASNPIPVTVTIAHGAPSAELVIADDVAGASVTCQAWADLVATLERTSAAPAPGSAVTYRARWRNEGSTTARAARLVIADDGTLLAPSGADPGSLARTYDLGDVPPSGPSSSGFRDLSYSVLPVLPSASNVLVERIALSTVTAEQDLADNVADRTDVVPAQADLWTTVALSPPAVPARPGDAIPVAVDYGNAGETATAGLLTIMLDANVTLVSSVPPPARVAGQALEYDLGVVPATGTGSVSLVVRVNGVMPSPAVTILVGSTVQATVADQNAANDADLASALVAADPDLSVSVQITAPNPPTIAAGGTIDGTITITNSGTTRATAVGATIRPIEPALVESATCLDGPCTSSGGTLTWTLGQVDVTPPAAPLVKRFRLVVKSALPASSNALTIEGRTYCNESEPVTGNNVDTKGATVTGQPDLKLVSMTPTQSVVRQGNVFQVDYVYSNVGSAPADPAELAVSYDPALLQPGVTSGAASSPGLLTFDWGAPLPPNAVATEFARFQVLAQPPPPNEREISQHAEARERPPIGLSRDANPADNSGDLKMSGCYVGVRTHVVSSQPQPCMGSGISIIADATPSTNVTYTWFEEGGLGRFSSTSSRVTTYFAPVTTTSATYRVHVVVADAANPACYAEAVVSVVPLTTCTSCGCGATNFNVQYDSAFTRWDRYGDKTATQGETVAFRVQLRQGTNQRAGWLLGGPGNTRMSFTDGTDVYVGWLSGDVWIECNQTYVVEFGPGVVPPTMDVGFQPIRFDFVTRDECGHPVQRDSDNNTGERVQILAAPAGNSGIRFTDWGPETQAPPPGR